MNSVVSKVIECWVCDLWCVKVWDVSWIVVVCVLVLLLLVMVVLVGFNLKLGKVLMSGDFWLVVSYFL